MKLVKLSLVAALAAGALATSASAMPLEEAIKGVDVSGMTKIKYTATSKKIDKEKAKKENKDEKSHGSKWNFKAVMNVKTTIDDNFFNVVSIRYDADDNGMSHSAADDQYKFEANQFFLGATFGNTTIQLGRQTIGAFFTDDMYGDGIKVLNTDVEGLVLAALFMDSLENDSDIGSNEDEDILSTRVGDYIKSKTGKFVTDHNLYGVAAIGSYDPISFQLWYASLEDVTNLFALELAGDFTVSDDVKLGLKGQYAFSDFDGKFKTSLGNAVDDGSFWAVEASSEFFGVDFSAGYIDFSTKENRLSLNSFEDQGSFISPGEELLDYSFYSGKNRYYFITAGYTIPDSGVRLGVDWVDGSNKFVETKTDRSEVVARVDYKYNEKLSFQSWYSHVDEKVKGADSSDKADKFRFQAKYSF
jgi:major outer membrane protein